MREEEGVTVRAIWPDGHMDEAQDYRTLERTLRQEQWHRWTPLGFRREMARRALAWSGTAIRIWGSSKRFIQEMERAGMLRLEEGE